MLITNAHTAIAFLASFDGSSRRPPWCQAHACDVAERSDTATFRGYDLPDHWRSREADLSDLTRPCYLPPYGASRVCLPAFFPISVACSPLTDSPIFPDAATPCWVQPSIRLLEHPQVPTTRLGLALCLVIHARTRRARDQGSYYCRYMYRTGI